jgi:hypothetical protein
MLSASLLTLGKVSAISASQIKLSVPDTSQYPTMHFSFWPFDSDGNFVSNLTTNTINVFENDQQVKLTSLQLIEPGTHFLIAVNEAATLGNSYAGKTRMDRMKEAWTAWAVDQSITTVDDFSLVNNDSILNDQLATPAEWVQAIEGYQPELKSSVASLNCMTLALDKLSNLNDKKTRAILFITPLPDTAQLTAIQDMASRAAAADIRLFIWLVGPQSYKTEGAAGILQQAAETTKGSFFIFSGAETLPAISSYLEPLRFEYQAVYQTTIQTPGSYTLAVQVDQTDYQQNSDKVKFDLKVSPPNPIFLSPPSTIIRSWVQDINTRKWSLTPTAQTIQYMIEFPDGHTRALKAARLFVDGALVAENTNAPFDEFKWDLSPYTESGERLLKITIEDVAGITASTIEIPVTITVNQKPLNVFQRIIDQVGWQTLGISLFLLLVGAGLVILFLRLRLRNPAEEKARQKEQRDPLRQSVIVEENEPASSNTKPQLKNPQAMKTPARLISMGGESAPSINLSFNLSTHGNLIGSDTVRCDIILTGPTISPVHTEIFCDAAQNYSVADRGSAAGTWLNYAPVSAQGARLENGDLVHIGATAFRFELTDGKKRTIQVEPYNRE